MGDLVCVRCGGLFPMTLGVHLTEEGPPPVRGIGFHCARCVAEVMAERRGTPLHWVEVEPIEIRDMFGRPRVFFFQHCVSEQVEGIEAFEIVDGEPGGYRVEVLAAPGEPQASVVGRLLGKIRRELARTHLRDDPDLSLGIRMTGSVLRGRIDCDPESRGPCAVVDGRRLDWKTFGELLLSREGFSFRLEFFDHTDEVP